MGGPCVVSGLSEWRRCVVRIDRGSRRWTVAVHEAAHVVAARRLGWQVVYARITDDCGDMDDAAPPGLDRVRAAVESAVISLAGTCASARMRWFLPDGCQHDQRDARTVLRGTEVSYREALARARVLVAEAWGDIQCVARRLYRDGEL